MKKIVNIESPVGLYVFTPPMSGVFKKVELSTGDIKSCIMQGAKVEEILHDGTLLRLDLRNYDKQNVRVEVVETSVVEQKKETVVEPPAVVEQVNETPVVEESIETSAVEEVTVTAVVEESVETPAVVEQVNETPVVETPVTEEPVRITRNKTQSKKNY